MTDVERTLTDQEMVNILQEIARGSGNAAARIAAIKEIRSITGEGAPAPQTQAETGVAFDLYAVTNNPAGLRVKG